MDTTVRFVTRDYGPADMTDRCEAASRFVHLVAGRWTLTVLAELATGGRRYHDLLDAVKGISPKVLTDTLRRAERDGLLARHLDAGRVETATLYELTDLGRSLDMPLAALGRWVGANWQRVEAIETETPSRIISPTPRRRTVQLCLRACVEQIVGEVPLMRKNDNRFDIGQDRSEGFESDSQVSRATRAPDETCADVEVGVATDANTRPGSPAIRAAFARISASPPSDSVTATGGS